MCVVLNDSFQWKPRMNVITLVRSYHMYMLKKTSIWMYSSALLYVLCNFCLILVWFHIWWLETWELRKKGNNPWCTLCAIFNNQEVFNAFNNQHSIKFCIHQSWKYPGPIMMFMNSAWMSSVHPGMGLSCVYWVLIIFSLLTPYRTKHMALLKG